MSQGEEALLGTQHLPLSTRPQCPGFGTLLCPEVNDHQHCRPGLFLVWCLEGKSRGET
jgi:hypothetical protein